MNAIKKITNIKNNSLYISDLNEINNKEVEVMILPLEDYKKDSVSDHKYPLRGKLVKYEAPYEPVVSNEDWDALK